MTTATTTGPNNQTAAVESESDRPDARKLFSQAIALRRERDATAQEDQLKGEEVSVAMYLKLLHRGGEPQGSDTIDLANTMVDLEISPEQAMQDIEIMEQALLFQDQRAQVDEAHRLSISTADEYYNLGQRHEVQEHEAFMAKETAYRHHSRCRQAEYELTKLRRQRPLLFTTVEEGGPIRLVGTDPGE